MESLLAPLVLIVLFILIVVGIIVGISQGMSQGAGTMTTTVLGANDALMSHEQKKAAEVIVEQKSGKKLEEQKSGDTFTGLETNES